MAMTLQAAAEEYLNGKDGADGHRQTLETIQKTMWRGNAKRNFDQQVVGALLEMLQDIADGDADPAIPGKTEVDCLRAAREDALHGRPPNPALADKIDRAAKDLETIVRNLPKYIVPGGGKLGPGGGFAYDFTARATNAEEAVRKVVAFFNKYDAAISTVMTALAGKNLQPSPVYKDIQILQKYAEKLKAAALGTSTLQPVDMNTIPAIITMTGDYLAELGRLAKKRALSIPGPNGEDYVAALEYAATEFEKHISKDWSEKVELTPQALGPACEALARCGGPRTRTP